MATVVRRRQQQVDDSGEYSDTSQERDQNNSDNEAAPDTDYDSRDSDDSEGSDQEHANSEEAAKRVDDDEDRSNPQYIPKRGTFYEHDDRTADGGADATVTPAEGECPEKEGGSNAGEAPSERRRQPKKSEVCDKWSHDKYNENEQVPKSRDELVSIYGYDIRNEEAPPHARRNRKYGRGPSKYTRTWEDEEAYRRQATTAVNRKPPNPEDFPELEKTAKKVIKKGRPPRSRSQPNNSNESIENGTPLRRNASIKNAKANATPKQNLANKNVSTKEKFAKTPVNKGQVKHEKLPPIENFTVTSMVNNASGQPIRKVNSTVAQQRPVPTVPSQAQVKRTVPTTSSNNEKNSASSRNTTQQTTPQSLTHQQTQTGTGSDTKPGVKRYSSLRQRPMALENYSPQPQHRYAQEYPQQGTQSSQHKSSSQIHPQTLLHQVVRSQAGHGPSPPHQTIPQPLPQQQLPQQPLPQQQLPQQPLPQQQLQQQPPLPQQQQHPQQVRLNMMDQQQMVSHSHPLPMHNMPQPHNIVSGQLQPPPAQGYAPPAMMPAQYMQGSNNSPVYGAAPIYAPQPPAPYPHQMYQHHNYATASGVTYYSPAEQDQLPRAQRRPTAAIPIVKPTQERAASSSENDNIDRIVENMFVRKPWPATRGADVTKEKSDRGSQEPVSKDNSQPNSLTSSSISTESRPSAERTESKEGAEKFEENLDVPAVETTRSTDEVENQPIEAVEPEPIAQDA